MVLPVCFLTIPALPWSVQFKGFPVHPWFAYSPTHTDYFGATSCQTHAEHPVPAVLVYVPTKTSNYNVYHTPYTCDPIPATSINKGNFQFVCKNLRGKNMGNGEHTLSFQLPAAASISIKAYTFDVTTPTSTAKYVINTSLAKTTLIPTTDVYVDVMITKTETKRSTQTVNLATGTSTCTSTVYVTVTVAPPVQARAVVPGPRLPVRRDGDAILHPHPADSIAVDDGDAENEGNDNDNDMAGGLEERAVTRVLAAAATPKIGKPDFTYPPYGVSTVYVKNIITRAWTNTYYIQTVYETASPTTITTSSQFQAFTTVTVTRTVTVAK
ncbi:hypothetical protein N0V88_005146 [Collariella sp. IMI 366227]|nr:hypothetical protein N0V88_005146 [Collariella sp. IMI 366227]